MNTIAFRAIFIGLIVSTLFGTAAVALDRIARTANLPEFFSWPMLAYMVSGVPFAWALKHVPGYGGGGSILAADGAMGTVILKLLASAWVTWAIVLSSVLYLRWRRVMFTGYRSRGSSIKPSTSNRNDA